MDLRTSLPASFIAFGCLVVVTIKTALAPAPPLRRQATAEERMEIAEAIASQERAWANETTQNFPGDHWSQRDDFHGREFRTIEDIANEKRIRIEDVLRAIDDDIHRRSAKSSDAPDGRHAQAVPCKPRPFYD